MIGTYPEWNSMMSYRRGDVILVRFPHSDLIEYSKRPTLVVQTGDLDTGLDQRIVALITSQGFWAMQTIDWPKGGGANRSRVEIAGTNRSKNANWFFGSKERLKTRPFINQPKNPRKFI